jgi:hypothetical protein
MMHLEMKPDVNDTPTTAAAAMQALANNSKVVVKATLHGVKVIATPNGDATALAANIEAAIAAKEPIAHSWSHKEKAIAAKKAKTS